MLQNDDSLPAEPGAHLAVESAAWQTLLNLLEEETRALIDGEADRLAPLSSLGRYGLQRYKENRALPLTLLKGQLISRRSLRQNLSKWRRQQ